MVHSKILALKTLWAGLLACGNCGITVEGLYTCRVFTAKPSMQGFIRSKPENMVRRIGSKGTPFAYLYFHACRNVLLTGFVIRFNHRHSRNGHLFQNRRPRKVTGSRQSPQSHLPLGDIGTRPDNDPFGRHPGDFSAGCKRSRQKGGADCF